MAEHAYPSLDNEEEPKIGFEGLTEDVKRERVDDKGVKKSSEEIGLIEIDKVLFFCKQTMLLPLRNALQL